MKKLLLTVLSVFLLGACSSNQSSNNNDSSKTSSSGAEPIITGESNTLVAYFSVTNHTEALAKFAQEHLECDLFEIVPTQEYTSEDIDYNSDCRANREQNDETARPQIKNKIEDMSKYDTIVLGYPIWWAQAPKIMYTFIESYDLTNKTILPFCTSGSSPIGSSATNLAKSAPKANWLEGKRFAAGTNKETFNSWLDENIKKDTNNMNLYIDNQKVDVTWEDNDSIKELNKLAESGLSISMSMYGGFEQVGSIGQSIARNDVQMTTQSGDIVLYSGNQLVVFYGSNSWSYTKLGKINLSQKELEELLGNGDVTITLALE